MARIIKFGSTDLEELLVLTFSDLEAEWEGGPTSAPPAWRQAFGRMRDGHLDYNRVCYIYDCNIRPMLNEAEMAPGLPIFHAAVVFVKDDRPNCLLMVRESNQLRRLLDEFDPCSLPVADDSDEIVGDYWHEVKCFCLEIGEGAEQNASPYLNWRCHSVPGWRSATKRETMKALVQKLQESVPDGQVVTPRIFYRFQIPGMYFRLKYEYVQLDNNRQIIELIEKDELLN